MDDELLPAVSCHSKQLPKILQGGGIFPGPLSPLPYGNTNPLGCYIASRPIGLFLLPLRQVRKLRIHEGNTGLRDSKERGLRIRPKE